MQAAGERVLGGAALARRCAAGTVARCWPAGRAVWSLLPFYPRHVENIPAKVSFLFSLLIVPRT